MENNKKVRSFEDAIECYFNDTYIKSRLGVLADPTKKEVVRQIQILKGMPEKEKTGEAK